MKLVTLRQTLRSGAATQQPLSRRMLHAGVLLAFACANLGAADISWTGKQSSSWGDYRNWNGGFLVIPNLTHDVKINGGSRTDTVVNGIFTIKSLNIANGYKVTVDKSTLVSLTVNNGVINAGSLNVTGGGFYNYGLVTNSGNINISAGNMNTFAGMTNTGTVTASGGAINLYGTINNAGGTINRTAGELNVGTLLGDAVIAGGTVGGLVANKYGTLRGVTLSGATVSGGKIEGATTGTGSIFDGVTLSSGASVTGGTFRNTTTANGAKVTGGTNTGTFNSASGTNEWSGGANSGEIKGATISGTLNNNSGTLTNTNLSNGSVINGGTIAGSTLANGTTINGSTISGTLTANGNNQLSGFTNNGIINIASGSTQFSGTIGGTGTYNVDAGSLTLADNTKFTSGGTLNVRGGSVNVDGMVDPLSTLNLYSGSLDLEGVLDVDVANLYGGTVTGTGSFGPGTDLFNSGVNLYIGGDGGAYSAWSLDTYNGSGSGMLIFDVGAGGSDSLTVTGGVMTGAIRVNLLAGLGSLTHISLIHGLTSMSGITIDGLAGTNWVTGFSGGTLYLDRELADSETPEPSSVILAGGALLALCSLRRLRASRT